MNKFEFLIDASVNRPVLRNTDTDVEYPVVGFTGDFIRTDSIDLPSYQVDNFAGLINSLKLKFPELLL